MHPNQKAESAFNIDTNLIVWKGAEEIEEKNLKALI